MKTDWNILLQGYLSLIWCQDSMSPLNQGKKVSDLRKEFKNKNEGIEPLNIGSLLSAAYICFMYPQQVEFEKLNFAKVSIENFSVRLGNVNNPNTLCRRIRNSLAHVRFEISNGIFTFKDQKPNGDDKFEATITCEHFGVFLNDFFYESKKQFFAKK